MIHRLHRDHTVAWFLAWWPILVGLVMITFSDRFTSRSWRFAGGMPGGYPMWAGVLIACGVLMVLALAGKRFTDNRKAAYFTGLLLVGLWWVMLGALFIWTAAVDPFANPLGGAVWTPIGILYWTWAGFEYRRL